MSLLCALFVVGIHVGWPHETPLSAGWLIYYGLKDGIARIAVPYFFVVSGFFLARHFDELGWWRSEVRKRVKTLVIPYVAWSLIWLIASIPLSIGADIIAHRPFGTSFYFLHGNHFWQILGLNLSEYPILNPLWYVRCLFLLVLVSGIINFFCKKFKYLWLAASLSLFVLHNHYHIDECGPGYVLMTQGPFFFSVGIAIQQSRRAYLCYPTRLSAIAIVGILCLHLGAVYNSWPYDGEIMRLCVPLLLLFTWCVMPAINLPIWLTSCAFPIYLIHWFVNQYMSRLLECIGICPFPCAVLTFLFGIAGSCAIALFLRRVAPRTAEVLFGGR